MMHIHVFGPTTVSSSTGVRVARTFEGVKPRQILAILALSAGRPVSKEQLADLLWDGQPPQGFRGTLESYVCLVRRALGGVGGRDGAIVTVAHGYLLDPASATVDLLVFRERAKQAHAATDPEVRLAHVQAAVRLVAGELLVSETYAAWAIREREHFSHELAAVACEGAAAAAGLGRHAEALHLARMVLASDPLVEEAWRHLMQALCATGRRSEALRAYHELRDLLAEELGTSPSRVTNAIYRDALALDEADAASVVGAREELRMLMQLLRRAVSSVPGIEVPADDGAMLQVASRLMAAS